MHAYSRNRNNVYRTDYVTQIDKPIEHSRKYNLIGNYPNPFNPTTSIKFVLAFESNLRIDIYNIKGQKVKTLLDTHYNAGEHSISWNGKDDNGSDVVSGVYFYKMQTNEFVAIKKMMLMK